MIASMSISLLMRCLHEQVRLYLPLALSDGVSVYCRERIAQPQVNVQVLSQRRNQERHVEGVEMRRRV